MAPAVPPAALTPAMPVDTKGVDMAPWSASPAQPATKASSVHASSAQLERMPQNIDLGFRKQHAPVVGNRGQCVQITLIYKRQTARISQSGFSRCTQIVSKSGRARPNTHDTFQFASAL
jgi:hypothetical protein